MNPNQENIIISEGSRPFGQTLLAAIFYTVTIAVVLYMIIIPCLALTEASVMVSINIIPFAILTFGFALRFSVINNIYFDIEKRLYKKEYAVGPVKVGKWEHLPNIEYISVFKQGWSKDRDGDGMTDATGYRYDVNVWHNTSKHFTIYSSNEPQPCLEMARVIALRLDTDLLDATVPNDKKWIELKA